MEWIRRMETALLVSGRTVAVLLLHHWNDGALVEIAPSILSVDQLEIDRQRGVAFANKS